MDDNEAAEAVSNYQEQKLIDRYGPVTSQADVMRDQAMQSGGMYKSSLPFAGLIYPPGYPLPPATSLDFADMDKVMAVAKQPAVWVERISNNSARLEFENIPNDQAMRIIYEVLPKVMELYLTKSKDYGGNVISMLKLGPKASFVDLWRKVGKLKRCLWDGEPMQGEQTDEILKDCIGHVLITLDEMNQYDEDK